MNDEKKVDGGNQEKKFPSFLSRSQKFLCWISGREKNESKWKEKRKIKKIVKIINLNNRIIWLKGFQKENFLIKYFLRKFNGFRECVYEIKAKKDSKSRENFLFFFSELSRKWNFFPETFFFVETNSFF